jgi:hypothetical protein
MLLGIGRRLLLRGAAAYLMDLYDKHLMAQDSVGVLRLAMVGYVAASAGVIHWWLADSGPSGDRDSGCWPGCRPAALFLWSRGSRWRHRAAMRAAGQLDPAMPQIPMAAKVFHPVAGSSRCTWFRGSRPATPAEARDRYEQWSTDRAARQGGPHDHSGGKGRPKPPRRRPIRMTTRTRPTTPTRPPGHRPTRHPAMARPPSPTPP